MIVGAAVVEIQVHGSQSLKQKRGVVRSITQRVRNRFNLAVSEVGGLDRWQTAVLGLAAAGAEPAPVEEGFVEIPDLVARTQPNGPTGYQVHVSGRAPTDMGPFVGQVLVKTSVPGEEAILVAVVGEVTDEEISAKESAFRNFPR